MAPIQEAIFLVKFQRGNLSLAFYQLLYRVVGRTCFTLVPFIKFGGQAALALSLKEFCFRQEHLKISQLTWFYPITKEANNLALKSSRESSANEQSN